MTRTISIVWSSAGHIAIALAFASSSTLLSACSPDRVIESEVSNEEPEPALEPPSEPSRLPLFDADGDLIESDQVVAGLRLPRGLTPTLQSDGRYVYRSRVEVEHLQRYFGVRLLTGNVAQPRPNTVIYREGTPRGAVGAAVPLDVSIEDSSRGTRVEIVEHRGGVREMTEAEAVERLREHLERAD